MVRVSSLLWILDGLVDKTCPPQKLSRNSPVWSTSCVSCSFILGFNSDMRYLSSAGEESHGVRPLLFFLVPFIYSFLYMVVAPV